jgi:hypothetical protein
MKVMQERMKTKIEANNKKLEALQGTLHLPDGYPPSQDRGHARKNGRQPKGDGSWPRDNGRNEGLTKTDEDLPTKDRCLSEE